VLLAVGVVAVVSGLAAFRVFQIARDLRNARNDLNAVETLLKAGQPAAARVALARGQAWVIHANTVVHNSPELSLVNVVPVARQNLEAMKSSVEVALRLTGGGRRLLDIAKPLESRDGKFEVPLRAGAIPLPVLRALTPQLADVEGGLPVLSDAPSESLLLPPVRELVRTVYRQADLRKRQLRVIGDGLEVLQVLSGGQGAHRVFIAVANAAEMRGTGGMILSYGELTAADGKFSLERFGNIDEVALSAPANVDLPQDYLDRFGPLGPALNWRNANLGVDFTYLGPAMEAMYKQATGKVADAVLQIDSKGLAALMRGTGPVDVPGLGIVNADNVVDVTLSQAYARFSSRTVRQEVLGDVAEAVFRKLVTGDYPSLRPLATAIVDAAAERRIILHMNRPDAQRAVVDLGVDGRLPGLGRDFATLAVENFSANKLDYYLDTGVRLTGDRVPGRVGHMRAEITITNTAPPGQTSPTYVFGPNIAGQRAGLYLGLATLYLPKGAGVISQTGDLPDGRVTVATEAERAAITFPVHVEAGKTQRVVVDLTLPPAPRNGYVFVYLPISRVRPTRFAADLRLGQAAIKYDAAPTRLVVLTGAG